MPGVVLAPSAHATKSGVSLVIVLGILLLISLVVLTFVRTTHDSRDTAQLATERLRSDHLLHAAFGRAMEDVNRRMAGRLFYWSVTNLGDLAADLDCIVSTNGTTNTPCSDILSATPLAEIPSCLTNVVISMATNVCQWIPMDYGHNGQYAYVVVNLSGFLDANVVGGMPSSNRTSPAEFDLSPLFWNPANDLGVFFLDRTNHVRYETRQELFNINTGLTNRFVDPLTVFSWDPDPDVFFTNTTHIGTRLFTNDLLRRTPITADYLTLTNILASCAVTNPQFVASCILDYQDSNRHLSTNWFTNLPDRITEAVPLLNEVLVETVDQTNRFLSMEFWYPFFPLPHTNEQFQIRISGVHDIGAIPVATFPITNLDFSNFTTCSVSVVSAPASNFEMNLDIQWMDGMSTTNWSTINTYRMTNNTARSYSLNDPRIVNSEDTNSTIGSINTNCQPWLPGCQGLPIFHPNRPMQNIGEIGYIFTGEPWRSLDLTQTNIAALLDRFTARVTVPSPRHGLVSAGTTNPVVWEAMFLGVPIGFTNTPLSYAGETTNGDTWAFSDFMSGRGAFARNYSELLHDIGSHTCYSNFLSGISYAGSDQREDILRGIVELVSFRHQLYLVVVAAQTLATDGRTMTAERRGMALVWRDGYTGQYFIRNFRWITD